jgi:energy-coupling factor transport system substrate-specific component
VTTRSALGLQTPVADLDEAEARERRTVLVPGLRIALLVLANVIGLLAFVWPFLLPSVARRVAENHQGDGPWIVAALGAILLALLFLELGRGGLGPKTVALLGVLGAAMVALRLPGFVAGFSALFIVVLVAGNALGPGFGFLLGCIGMFASGIFVGGLGPWLPFEMVAVGWVGAGAGLLPHGSSWRTRIAWLAAFGFASGYLYGLVMELWFWPFLTDGSALAWDPGGGTLMNVRHYLAFYVVDGLTWDTFRAVGNVVLVIAIGRPVLAALDRAARRMQLRVG